MNILREFWNTRMGKAQVVSTLAFGLTTLVGLYLRSLEVLRFLPILGGGIAVTFLIKGLE